MNTSPTSTELTALRVANTAVRNSSSPNSHIIDTAIFALGAAQLLQSPETAAELDALRARVVELEQSAALVDTDAADFYRPGHTYVSHEFPQYGWQFRCDVVTTHPEDGERTALGWRFFNGQWEAYAYDELDWSVAAVGGVVEETVAQGQAPAESSAVCPRCGHPPGVHRPGGCIADSFRTGLIGLCGCMAEDTSATKGGA